MIILPLDVILSVFARVGRDEIMRDEYHLGNCILSTRVTVEVLRHYGVKAKAVSVQTFIGPNNRGNGDGISLDVLAVASRNVVCGRGLQSGT